MASVLCVATAAIAIQEEASDNRSSRVDYRIEARLEAETKALTGSETITWTNRSRDTVSDLWFHLYLNAFSNNLSTHLWESKGKTRDRKFAEQPTAVPLRHLSPKCCGSANPAELRTPRTHV